MNKTFFFARLSFFRSFIFFILLLPSDRGSGADVPSGPPSIKTNVVSTPVGALSASLPVKLASWQENLTLGPGDVFSISLYGEPGSAVPDMFVGPDGRINYLEAHDVMAADLTVDQLRDQLETILAKSHLTPRVIINPLAYRSKKYYLLGNLMQKGVYLLDKPTTIVEAIARAKGFVTAIDGRTSRTMVNFGHSFLIRKNEDATFVKVPVDFEALFMNGELGQNQRLAPDDYLYFPPLGLQDVYVLGEVLAPGVTLYANQMTALQAITKRGGFTEAAFRQRILVVRGSLSRPETFVVNASQILSAKGQDFEVKPGDILYVSRKPWAKAEELLDIAVRGFVQSAVITWTGNNIGPFIK